MSKIKNKAFATDWHQEEKKKAKDKEYLEEEQTAFRQVNHRRRGFPSGATLEELGFQEVANMVYCAYALLERAESLLLSQIETQEI